MIDTVILTIPREKVITLESENKDIGPWDLQSRSKGFEKVVKNPSKKDKESGLYFPRLTGLKRGLTRTVKIEFSAPKLMFGENLSELEENQFSDILERLQNRLERMGLLISRKDLEEANVIGVHYSKNFEIINGYTSQYIIGELNKINASKKFDLTRVKYMNDGQSFCIYCTSHSFIIYDKIADLIRGKGSIDTDKTVNQLNLFKELNNKREILRVEARLARKAKIKSLFENLGINIEITFKNVFSKEISQKVIIDYWKSLVADNSLLLFAHSLSNKDLFNKIKTANPKLKLKQSIYFTGLILLMNERNGIRELRSMSSKNNSNQTWYRVWTDFKEISKTLEGLKPRDWFEQITNQLKDYKSLKYKK